jgi:uncharacterized protein
MMRTTTIQIPVSLRDRLERRKQHPRQPYSEVIVAALDRTEDSPVLEPRPANGDPILHRHRRALRALARRHGLVVSVFGSRARGTARDDSDLDLLYVLGEGRTLFDVIAFKQDAESLTGVPVEMLSASISRPRLRARVQEHAIAL